MSAKEKAKELVNMFTPFSMDNHIEKYAIINAKQCALICVEECKKVAVHIDERFGSTFEFWEEVEKELKK